MKKTRPRKRVSAAKAKAPNFPKTVEQYLARVPEPARSTLNQIRAAVRAAVPPESTEVISYRMPAFKHRRVLVWYGAFTDHCSLFPTSAVLQEFKDQLKDFATSKGTVQFPNGQPVPTPLIKEMVKSRLARSKPRRPSR
ncbi:MAG TPA: DUF1801 domain-containing protein [Terriglobales bacterium]|nr:DUF1801 domain-containing protein [Terriglobales bacterium]